MVASPNVGCFLRLGRLLTLQFTRSIELCCFVFRFRLDKRVEFRSSSSIDSDRGQVRLRKVGETADA